MQQAYLSKLKDAAKRLRQVEREYVHKTAKLYGVQGEVRLPNLSELDKTDRDAGNQEKEQE